jgi:hypothetical protein
MSNAAQFGHWLLDNQHIYYNKLQTIIEAQSRNSYDIRFYYHDNIFGSHDWKNEPQSNIEDLYMERALQLRQKYDYLILLYSGGSDSSNALKVFLKNNIKIDEVAYWYSSYDLQNNLANSEVLNAGSELLNSIIIINGIKVSKMDMKPQFEKGIMPNIEWFMTSEPSLSLEQLCKPKLIFENSDWLKKSEKNKVGVIIGLEKPRIWFENGVWYSAFLDVTNAYNFGNSYNSISPISLEPFYVSPDSPLVTIKQSHLVKNYINKTYTLEFIEKNFNNDGNFNGGEYFSAVRAACYPYWSDKTFSLGKEKSILKEKNRWIWDSNSDFATEYFTGLEWISNNVDPYFINGNNIHNGLVGTWSKRYLLGE